MEEITKLVEQTISGEFYERKEARKKLADIRQELSESNAKEDLISMSDEKILRCFKKCLNTGFSDEAYNEFTKTFADILKTRDAESEEETILFCIWVAQILEISIDKMPEVIILYSLIMDTLEKAVNYGMSGKYQVTVMACEYQRDIYSRFSDNPERDLNFAGINRKEIVPCILAGRRAKAFERGMTALKMYMRLYEDDQDEYASGVFEICLNVGGLYMDIDELKKAEMLFNLAETVWDDIPDEEKEADMLSVNYKILKDNQEKLQRKME